MAMGAENLLFDADKGLLAVTFVKIQSEMVCEYVLPDEINDPKLPTIFVFEIVEDNK